ncbi:hypothetical protein Anas_12122, partial [Armadillidium nasatum]
MASCTLTLTVLMSMSMNASPASSSVQMRLLSLKPGDNCERGLQPLVKGMKLVKKSSCDDYTTNSPTKSSKVAISVNGTERPAFPAWWPSTTRKPWFKKSTTTTKPKNLWNDQ